MGVHVAPMRATGLAKDGNPLWDIYPEVVQRRDHITLKFDKHSYTLSTNEAFMLVRALLEATALVAIFHNAKGSPHMPKKKVSSTKKSKVTPAKATKVKKPNKLYFYENASEGKKQYYWTLQSSNGKTIGASSESYSKKIYAAKNAINLFGREILDGVHEIQDEVSSQIVFTEMRKQGLFEGAL